MNILQTHAGRKLQIQNSLSAKYSHREGGGGTLRSNSPMKQHLPRNRRKRYLRPLPTQHKSILASLLSHGYAQMVQPGPEPHTTAGQLHGVPNRITDLRPDRRTRGDHLAIDFNLATIARRQAKRITTIDRNFNISIEDKP